jgi:polar amino acid transport system permease protein
VTDKFDKTPADEPPMHSAVSKGATVPPPQIKAIPVRHWGRWLSGVVVVAVLGMLVYAFAQGDINWDTVGDFVFDDRIIKGAVNTVIISVLSMIIGLVLGVVFAVMRLSKNPVTGAVAWLYIWLFRGTPVYVQLLLWFNLALIFPILNIGFYKDEMVDVMTPFAVALLGLGLNEGAYMAEIVRAGIRSVDPGQREAAEALGMSHRQVLRRVVLPQAMRVIIPPTGNQFISMLKTTSMVSVIAGAELLTVSQRIYLGNFEVIAMLIVASIWYIVLTTIASVGQHFIEKRFERGHHALQVRVRRNLRPFSRGNA